MLHDDVQNLVDHCKGILETSKDPRLAELLGPFEPSQTGPITFGMMIPTYNGGSPDYDHTKEREPGALQEYGDPQNQVYIQRTDAIRVLFGCDDLTQSYSEAHDVLVERQHDKWAVMFHPNNSDPECLIYIPDDRSKPIQILGEMGQVFHEQRQL